MVGKDSEKPPINRVPGGKRREKLLAEMLVVQALANMAVAVNLIPVTGQPLPLISRGGTSTVLTCCYFGIILSISRFGANMGNSEKDSEEETVLEQDTQSLTEEEVSNWIPEEHTEESER